MAQGMEDKCCIAQHSAAWMAGEFAATIKAKQLVLTHFSARWAAQPPAGLAGCMHYLTGLLQSMQPLCSNG